MDKVEKLEKRIEELEERINTEKKIRELQTPPLNKEILKYASSFIEDLITRDKKSFRNAFMDKYSKENLPEGSKHLCIKKALKESKKKNNNAEKLQYWKSYKDSLDNRKNIHWTGLQYFVSKAIEYYEERVIAFILDEERFFKKSGNKETWDSEKTVKWWDEMPTDWTKTKRYNEIRKRHNPNDPNKKDGVPVKPTEKTIRNQLQEADRV